GLELRQVGQADVVEVVQLAQVAAPARKQVREVDAMVDELDLGEVGHAARDQHRAVDRVAALQVDIGVLEEHKVTEVQAHAGLAGGLLDQPRQVEQGVDEVEEGDDL